jgi:hypothetical protein
MVGLVPSKELEYRNPTGDERMTHPLVTKLPGISPLSGLLKIDQIAFCARTDEDERALKARFRLDKADWVEDHVVAEGYVRGGRQPGEPRGLKNCNVAKLLFNYDLGIELEILRYLEGHNYVDQAEIPSGQICHIGAHVEKGVDITDPSHGLPIDFVIPAPIIQQVETVTHTNDFLVKSGRRYRYTIYDTKPLLGVFFKIIERLERE